MRTIERSSAVKRDYKRQIKRWPALDADLTPVLKALASDQPLAASHRDHGLTAEWLDYRECHIKPDLLLIYGKADGNILRLARLGSHSDLFG